jgi:hypothetical protein
MPSTMRAEYPAHSVSADTLMFGEAQTNKESQNETAIVMTHGQESERSAVVKESVTQRDYTGEQNARPAAMRPHNNTLWDADIVSKSTTIMQARFTILIS